MFLSKTVIFAFFPSYTFATEVIGFLLPNIPITANIQSGRDAFEGYAMAIADVNDLTVARAFAYNGDASQTFLPIHINGVADSDNSGFETVAALWTTKTSELIPASKRRNLAEEGEGIYIDGTRSEIDWTVVRVVAPQILEDANAPIPNVSGSTLDAQTIDAYITSKYSHYQLRIDQMGSSVLSQNPEEMVNLVNGFRGAASNLFSVTPDRVILTDIVNDGPTATIVRFTIFPMSAAEEERWTIVWSTAVSSGSNSISEYFPNMDSKYPAIFLTGEETTTSSSTTVSPPTITGTNSPSKTTEEESSSKRGGVVAGAVIGSVVLAALVGGTGGYLYKKKVNDDAAKDAATENMRNVSDMGEKTPGSVGNRSPGTLTNVNVQAPATPNPHNYKL